MHPLLMLYPKQRAQMRLSRSAEGDVGSKRGLGQHYASA